MTGRRPRTLALTGDLLILIAFPFLGAVNHENSVTVESFVRTLLNAEKLYLSHLEANTEAGAFYQSLGYKYTGEKDEDGELMMVLDL